MSFDSILTRIDGYLKKARAILPGGRQLPYIVHSVTWPGGKEVPGHLDIRAFMAGKIQPEDWPGYEQRNQEALQMAEEAGVRPKEYLFDVDAEFDIGVRQALSKQAEFEFKEWSDLPPSIPTD